MSDFIAYATPAHRRSYWAEAILCFTGLGLIFLGGCFLIGIGFIYGIFGLPNAPITWTAGTVFFASILYALSFGSILSAVWLIALAVRRLMK